MNTIVMQAIGIKDRRGYPLYESDIIRDADGGIGLVVWNKRALQWDLSYELGIEQRLAVWEYDSSELLCLGNIHQHPDWKNWREEQSPKALGQCTYRVFP